jgi:hypothetical protein
MKKNFLILNFFLYIWFSSICVRIEVIVVTRETGSVNVQKYVTELYNGKLAIDLVVVPDLTGGAESLIHIKPKLKVSSFL